MFKVGDIVAHPLHGAGIIDGLETKKVLSRLNKFFILNLIDPAMDKLFIPVNMAQNSGLRYIGNLEIVGEVEEFLKEKFVLEIKNGWKEQFKNQEKKVNSGDLLMVAEAYKFLFHKNMRKKLGATDRGLMKKALHILSSELHFIMGKKFILTKETVETWVRCSYDEPESEVA
ncbi:MAG: CarD family transcriptional regulator [Candidatus Muiribacteriota bacterium]